MKGHLIDERLLGVAIYNPGILSKDELVRLFVARRNLLQQIISDLRREKVKGIPQHRLLVGARGMGKSTLLHRISYAVEDDPALSAVWIPLTFPEEQYNVARLSDLWLNCLDALSDALERSGKHDEAEALDDIIDGLPGKNEEERSRKALEALLGHAQRMGKRLLLLIDNIDLVLDRLAKEHWTIREMLAKEDAPLLIGATSRPLEPTYVYEGAFYDFFKIDNLNKLQLEEMHGVLQTLSTELKAPQVAELLKSDPARIRVLYDLTGGNPRTTVLLFGVLAQGIDGDVRTDLERLLDQCTPLYKARFEELSNQAQQVVDALALHWDPATAAAVAERAHLDVNSVSSHLNRLSEQGIVEKVRLYPKKKTGFQLSERFFNIWYLMRASRRMRRKLIWLSRFLKSFYSQEELHGLAHRYLSKHLGLDEHQLVKHAEYGFALADALEDCGWRRALEHTASQIVLSIESCFRELLSESGISLDGMDHQALSITQIKQKIEEIKIDWKDVDRNIFCDLLCQCPLLKLSFKTQIVESLGNVACDASVEFVYSHLAKMLEYVTEKIKCEDLTRPLFHAVGAGLMDDWNDVEGASSAVHVLGEPALLTLAIGNKLVKQADEQSVLSYKNHLKTVDLQIPWFWLKLAEGQQKINCHQGAEESYLHGLKLFPKDVDLMSAYASFLAGAGRLVEAVSIFEDIVKISPQNSNLWRRFGQYLTEINKLDEAEKALAKAIQLDPENAMAWHEIGYIRLYYKKDLPEAEKAFRKAITIREDEVYLRNLGAVLIETGRVKEAEQKFLRAVSLNPNSGQGWNGLGVIAMSYDNNAELAEEYLTKAIAVAPNSIEPLVNCATLYVSRARYNDAKEMYRRCLLLRPDDLDLQIKLAAMHAYTGDWEKAELEISTALSNLENAEMVEGILLFCRAAVQGDRAKDALDVLLRTQLVEQWRPAVEALKAVLVGTTEYFVNIAPEVRNAAETIYKELTTSDMIFSVKVQRLKDRQRRG